MLNPCTTETESTLIFFIEASPRIAACIIDNPKHIDSNDLYIGFKRKTEAQAFCRIAIEHRYGITPTVYKAEYLKGGGIRWEVRVFRVCRSLMNELAKRDMQDFAAEKSMSRFLNECVVKGSLSTSERTNLLNSMRSKGSLFKPVIR
ncbi:MULTISPECIES: hypothetical protein [Trichocoleus]|uniref:Homing endonuclease LAGLIDADG domain-containing protein n=1 Tax=Trichocoleus desertorum GB2-A4 TaxID=2933944 RepID=A0ABV0JHU0_9CYAN|nr:hypothetical protein [Trichocoleus sp. FACHB-46]MBD1865673.1 hypothetical protein [Trichocoleus sp. FACHB-46]